MTTTSSERRLHPLSVLFTMGPQLQQLLLPFIALLFSTREFLILGGLLGGATLLIAAMSVISYLRYSYSFAEGELVIRSGIFTRNERRIPYARIQNLDAAQTLVQRMCGVIVVHVQTGGGALPEASLRVLTVPAMDEMRAQIAAGVAGMAAEVEASAETPVAPRRILLELPPRELLLAGFIENRGMLLILGAFAFVEQTGLMERIIRNALMSADSGLLTRWLGTGDISVARGTMLALIGLFLALVFIRLLSTIWAVVRLFDFRLARIGDDLHMEYGLFTRVTATIPLKRIQVVVVHENMLHRAFGRRAVVVQTAGGPLTEDGRGMREPVAPIVHLDALPALLQELQPGLQVESASWRPVHPGAFGRILRGSLAWVTLIGGIAVLAADLWGVAILLLLGALAFVRARMRSRWLGWCLTDDSIMVRDGALTRITRVARYNRVQVASVRQTPLDLRMGMAGVRADTAGAFLSGVVVPFMPTDGALALHEELRVRATATAFTW